MGNKGGSFLLRHQAYINDSLLFVVSPVNLRHDRKGNALSPLFVSLTLFIYTFFPMGTRSRIGLQLKDQIISVYHHWDGYPSWLGVTLNKKFNTREKVEELIDGGDMSSCDSEYGWDYNYNTGEGKREVTSPTYYSERGEDCPPKISESITEYLDQTENTDGEYAYLFDNGEWTCYDIGQYGSGVKGKILDIPADFPVRETV